MSLYGSVLVKDDGWGGGGEGGFMKRIYHDQISLALHLKWSIPVLEGKEGINGKR